jgi:protein phosphatase
MVEDLVPAARDQVVAGIQAGNLDDARAVIARLAGQMLPVCPTVIEPTTPVVPNTAFPNTAFPNTASPTAPGSSATSAGAVPGTPSTPATGSALTATVPTIPIAPTVSSEVTGGTTGTPLSTRALEPGVTCRVIK